MSEPAPIENPLKVTARASLVDLNLVSGGDHRFYGGRRSWKMIVLGNIEIAGQPPNRVEISFVENKSAEDDSFGSFQPSFEAGPAYLNLLLSPAQWAMLVQAFLGSRPLNLSIDAVISLDVANYADSFGGRIVIFHIGMSHAG